MLLSVLFISFLFPTGEAIDYNVEVGDIWNSRDLVSSDYFPILKDPYQYNLELEKAEKEVLPIFELYDSIKVSNIDSVKNLLQQLKKSLINKKSKKNQNSLDSVILVFSNKINLNILNNLVREKDNDLIQLMDETFSLVNLFYERGIIDEYKINIKTDTITLKNKNKITKVSKYQFYDLKNIENSISERSNNIFPNNFNLRKALSYLVTRFAKPNILYNHQLTLQKIEEARAKVSKNIGIVAENEKIVSKNQRITPEIKQKLYSYKVFKSDNVGIVTKIIQGVGKFLHILIITYLFVIYIYVFRKKIFYNTTKVALICSAFVFVSLTAYITNIIHSDYPIELLILISVSSMLLTIFFDSRVGFYSTVILAFIVGGIKGNNYSVTIIHLVAGGLAAYSVRDIKSRSQIFISILFIFSGYFIALLALGLERFETYETFGEQLSFAMINAVLSPVIANGLLVFFEKTFKLTTELTLIDLQSPSNPLIQRLQIKTPGTHHHSLIMSTMVEAAALAIEANAVLAKVGALFHDIGKTENPSAFIENQKGGEDIHSKLSPEESAAIIIKHIEDGIELAKKYDLPPEVIDFIPMHHGTTTAKYFYLIAKKKNKDVDEALFKYPGPIPNSKETAIVMLADAIESTARSIQEPTREELMEIINATINSRYAEGQLNDCDLTFKELNIIKESFLNTLLGIHHTRITYPTQNK